MIAPAIHAQRRARLRQHIQGPIVLLGNAPRPRNLPGYGLPFRQDSTFLYFTGCTHPNAALLMTDDGETLFLPPPAPDDALWHGHSSSIEEMANQLGFASVRPIGTLEDACAPHAQRLHTLAVADHNATRRAGKLTGDHSLLFGTNNGSEALIDAVITQRRILDGAELAEMRAAAAVTDQAHRAAMAVTRVGGHEREVSAVFDAVLATHGCPNAYTSIVTVHGEILHNEHTTNTLQAGQLLLLDGGAESPGGYATDVTRTWPVSGHFSARQRAAYDAVLAAQQKAISMVRPGVRYRDIHMAAAHVLATFLHDEKLLRVSPDNAMESGAHALFFPHGVGHLIGLDVHDLEAFGDRAHYAPGRVRSKQFGTAYLRLDLDLEPGMVVTIEPGLYIVPAILNDPALTTHFADQVDFARAEQWMGFGGIRIEDDVLTTAADPDVLTDIIPKQATEIEALVQTVFDWSQVTCGSNAAD